MAPLSLLGRRENDYPVHKASVCETSVVYVPLLLKASIKHHSFEESDGFGLFVSGNNGLNILQNVVSLGQVDVMKDLFDMNFFTNEVIETHSLIYYAAVSGINAEAMLDYLLDLEPHALNMHLYNGLPISHAVLEYGGDNDEFRTLIKVSIKRNPLNPVGLLFQKDDSDCTAFSRALYMYEEEAIFNIISEFIPFHGEDIPILHYVAKGAYHLMDLFMKYYSAAACIKDSDGRTLPQAILGSGNMKFSLEASFFVHMTDTDLRITDPKDHLYPFMMAAASLDSSTVRLSQHNHAPEESYEHSNIPDNHPLRSTATSSEQSSRCDLDAIFYLLRRAPCLVCKHRRILDRTRKRKINTL